MKAVIYVDLESTPCGRHHFNKLRLYSGGKMEIDSILP